MITIELGTRYTTLPVRTEQALQESENAIFQKVVEADTDYDINRIFIVPSHQVSVILHFLRWIAYAANAILGNPPMTTATTNGLKGKDVLDAELV
jgi:hypothetical protein